MIDYLLSPNVWVGVATASAVVGIVLAITSVVMDLPWLVTPAVVLIAPTVILGTSLFLRSIALAVVERLRGE